MSQSGGSQPLGTARVDFTGDTSKLKASAKEAEAVVAQTAQKIEATQAQAAAGVNAGTAVSAAGVGGVGAVGGQAGGGANAAAKNAAESIKGAVGGFTSLISLISRFLGILGLVVTAVTLVISLFRKKEKAVDDSTEATNRYAESLRGLYTTYKDLLSPITQYESAVRSLQNATGDFVAKVSADAKLRPEQKAGLLRSAYENEFKYVVALQAKAEEDGVKAKHEAEAKKRQDNADTLRKYETEQRNAQAEVGTDQERIDEEERQRINDLYRERALLDTDDQREAVDRAIAAEKEKFAARRIEAENAYTSERIQLKQAADDAIAEHKRLLRAQQDAIDQIRGQAAAQFPADQTAIIGEMRNLTDLLGIIGSQRSNPYSAVP